MTEKYIHLASRISDDLEPTMAGEAYICNALRWLDLHPDQVPGLTMTETEMEHKCATYGSSYETGFKQAGGVVIPPPLLTNSEKWQELLARYKDDATGLESFADWADRQGLKAPEATND